jgi:chemotaxis response regulator CheB
MLDDGAAGLQAVKQFGGRAIGQDPDATYDKSMPAAR